MRWFSFIYLLLEGLNAFHVLISNEPYCKEKEENVDSSHSKLIEILRRVLNPHFVLSETMPENVDDGSDDYCMKNETKKSFHLMMFC
jgi:hypothetical protein